MKPFSSKNTGTGTGGVVVGGVVLVGVVVEELVGGATEPDTEVPLDVSSAGEQPAASSTHSTPMATVLARRPRAAVWACDTGGMRIRRCSALDGSHAPGLLPLDRLRFVWVSSSRPAGEPIDSR